MSEENVQEKLRKISMALLHTHMLLKHPEIYQKDSKKIYNEVWEASSLVSEVSAAINREKVQ